MSEQVTICFVGTSELKATLERWAAEDDRSVSYVLRRILTQEAKRRTQNRSAQPKEKAGN